MSKTITWAKAVSLIEDATAVSVESHSSELNYPSCECDDGAEECNVIRLSLNDDVEISIYDINNHLVEVTQSNGHLVFTDSNDELVELELLVSKAVK